MYELVGKELANGFNNGNDGEDLQSWLSGLDWEIYDQPSFDYYGEKISVTYISTLTDVDVQKFHEFGLANADPNKIRCYKNSREVGGGRILWTRLCTPQDLGDASYHDVDEMPAGVHADIPCPDGLSYLDHQLPAILAMDEKEYGCWLADDMGLGKTIMACGLLNLRRCQRVLIIAPSSMKLVWADELQKWLTYAIPVNVMDAADLRDYPDTPGIYVTNYENMRKEEAYAIKETRWDMVILDEAQRIKNPESLTCMSIAGGMDEEGNVHEPIQADYKLLLSGTPMPNRAVELWSSFNFLFPNIFVSELRSEFKSKFAGSGSRGYVKNAEALRSWFEAASIRRRKSEVLSKYLGPKERATELLTIGAGELSRLHKVENEAIASSFSKDGMGVFTVAMTDWSRVWSETALAKAVSVAEYVLKFLDENPDKKLVVFRHHKIIRDALQMAFKVRNIRHVNFDGEMDSHAKRDAVKKFQENPSTRVIVVSILSGGLGITLTESHNAIFAEINPVPSNLIQCEDRLHRIGQDNDVMIRYLFTYGSIEAHMASILTAKIPQIESVVDGYQSGQKIVEAKLNLRDILVEIGSLGLAGFKRFGDIYNILLFARKPESSERMYNAYLPGLFKQQIERMTDDNGKPFKVIRTMRRPE